MEQPVCGESTIGHVEHPQHHGDAWTLPPCNQLCDVGTGHADLLGDSLMALAAFRDPFLKRNHETLLPSLLVTCQQFDDKIETVSNL